jgi:hypothetical protein
VATMLWVSSTLLLRVYDEQFSSSDRIYSPLKPAAVLLLWLYFTGAAVLIGGEANSEIGKAGESAFPGRTCRNLVLAPRGRRRRDPIIRIGDSRLPAWNLLRVAPSWSATFFRLTSIVSLSSPKCRSG